MQGENEAREVEIRLLASQAADIALFRPRDTNKTLESLVFGAARGLVPLLDPDPASQLLQRLMVACRPGNGQR